MKLKTVVNKLLKTKKKVKSDDSYIYSQIIWNNDKNLIILLSFTEDYHAGGIIELQDAINATNGKICSKVIFSSYDEETNRIDENGAEIIIIHKKCYMLIGGQPEDWQTIYFNINNISNEALAKISDEITNNCSAMHFKRLIDDGILSNFCKEPNYIYDDVETDIYCYTNPYALVERLPECFIGRDILKFILVTSVTTYRASALVSDICTSMTSEEFKEHQLYPLFSALFKEPIVSCLRGTLNPLYMQTDGDSIPGDVSDESLDDIFREEYERFSALVDEAVHYEDIDEELADDEESENIHERDKI